MASGVDTGAPGERHAQDTEVVSMDLPAPPGWGKKYTPRKGGPPKRNEIVFTSPTGEQIANKRKLEQYLRSHPGGPPPSEFDWGVGDTPRRSSRLTGKPKATEISKDKKTKKKQEKSISKKGLNKKSKNTESEAPEEAKDSAATKESAELEMTDADGHAEKKSEESAAASVEQRPTEKKSEGKEGPEEAASLPDAGKNAKEVEGKEDSKDLHPVSEEGMENKLKKTETVALLQTSDVHKKEAPAEKDIKEEEGAAVTAKRGATDKKSKTESMDNILAKTEESNEEGPEEVGKANARVDASHSDTGSEAKEVKLKEDSNNLPPVSEEKGEENGETKTEDTEMVSQFEETKNGDGNKEHPEESVVQIQTSEDHKEAVTAAKDGVDVLSKNDGLVQGSTVY